MPLLRIHIGPDNELTYTITRKVCTIGRGEKNDVVVNNHKVSRLHARIVLYEDGYYLVDCNSSNGIWTSAGQCTKLKLENEVVFTIGNAEFSYWEEESIQDAQPTQMVLTEYKHAEALRVSSPLEDNYMLMLQEIIISSAQANSRSELFDLVDDAAAESLDGDRCAVFLPSPDGWILWPPHKMRLRARFGATAYSHTILDTMRAHSEPLLCTRESENLPRSDSMSLSGVSSAMAAPIRVGEHVYGLLYIDRLGKKESFSQQALGCVTAVANQLAISLANLHTVAELQGQVERLQDPASGKNPSKKPAKELTIIGRHAGILAAKNLVHNIKDFNQAMLIVGENGCGKTHVATALHTLSPFAHEKMHTFNCSSIDPDLIAVRLFGGTRAGQLYESSIPGFFELANGSAALLEDIQCLDAYAQKKLHHLLATGEIIRCNHTTVRTVDIQLLCTATLDVDTIEEPLYNPALLKKLSDCRIDLPTLVERQEDIDPLIRYFISRICSEQDIPLKRFHPEAHALLLAYPWPGNVSQLHQVITHSILKTTGDTIDTDVLPATILGTANVTDIFEAPLLSLSEMEKEHIKRVLLHCDGNKKACALQLGINRSTLYAKIRLYNLE